MVFQTTVSQTNLGIYLLSLGCAKNLVDAECMSKLLTDEGYHLTLEPDDADILIVNTCGFIESAKKEAIDAILTLADYKKPLGSSRFLIVTGCLSQRYGREIQESLPEVDAVVGTAEYGRIGDVIRTLLADDPVIRSRLPGPAGGLEHLKIERLPSNPGRYAYIKIAEGCVNCCSYCAIPSIRGTFRSRPAADIVEEAKRLSRSGRDELILIAQDSSYYGMDLDGRRQLANLVRDICRIDAVRMVRILYAYADGLTDELIERMALEPKVARYLDLPIQHASDRILHLMNRRDRRQSLIDVISRLRQAMPDLILRTTVMVGFPGEEEEDFAELMSFLEEIRFDRLGCFVFSPEEGTPAYSFQPKVKKSIARHRMHLVMKQQRQITEESNRRRIGQTCEVVLENIDEHGIFFIGRSYGEAPDVDPIIRVAASSDDLSVGRTCLCRLIDAGEYDMTGVTLP